MATVAELESALIRAHEAGDGEAARMLTKEIQQARRLSRLTPGGGYTAGTRSTVIDPPEPTAFERVSRGVWDGVQGTKQAVLMATDKEAAEQYRKAVNEEEARYQAGRGPEAGFDLARLAGNVLAGAPLAAAVTYAAPVSMTAAGAGLAARMGLGAIQGGTQGALTYSPEGTLGHKAKQAVIGTVAGGAGPLVADAVSHVAAHGVEGARTLLNKAGATPERIIEAIEPVLAARGVKWSDLGNEVREGMLSQARRQISIDGELTPEALVRKLEMEDLLGPGAGPTRGQVTRDPQQWSWERNTQKLNDIGLPITERFQAQISRLRQVADEELAKLGGRARNDYQAGVAATKAVQQKMDESKRVVDDLYTVWRESGAGTTEVRPQRLADELLRLEDEVGIDNIPPVVRSRLESFGMAGGTQKKLLTIDEAEKLRKLIGNNDPGQTNPTVSMATQRLKRALDESVMDTESPDIPSLKAARSAARDRFQMRDSGAGVTAAAKDEAPDRFFKRYVLGGDVADLRGLKATLNTSVMGDKPTPGMVGYEPAGAQAWKDMKTRALEYAVEKASTDKAGFSGPMFRKALKEIGEERLKVLFEPEELAQIAKLDRVAHGLTAEPALAAVNHSNTAATGAQYLRDAGRAIPQLAEMATGFPLIGKMAAGAWSAGDDLARNAEMRRRVSHALLGDASDPATVKQRREALAMLLSGRLGPAASAAGAGSTLYFTR